MKSASDGPLKKGYVPQLTVFFVTFPAQFSILLIKRLNPLQIKRPYFHVKALEKTQLNNWKEYLDFEIEQGQEARVLVLFERCLIACALYEEFWLKVAESFSLASPPLLSLHFPIHDDNHIETVNVLHSLCV